MEEECFFGWKQYIFIFLYLQGIVSMLISGGLIFKIKINKKFSA